MEKNNKEKQNLGLNMAHYKKINIFGSKNVGKSCFISLLENYKNKNFTINGLKQENNIDTQKGTNNLSLADQTKKLILHNSNNSCLYIKFYETNISNFDFIKDNLDTLLLHTECVIFMLDITKYDSFESINGLLPVVMEKLNEKYGHEIPSFLIKNKSDLKPGSERIEINVIKLLCNYQKITQIEMSLLTKENISEFIKELFEKFNDDKEIKVENIIDAIHSVKIIEPLRINEIKIKNIPLDNYMNILLLGDSSVGKTEFLSNLFNANENKRFNTTIGMDKKRILAEIDERNYGVNIWDTAGQERFSVLSKTFLVQADGIFLFFDLTNEDAFKGIANWIGGIKKARGEIGENSLNEEDNLVLFLVGNKIDLNLNNPSRALIKESAENYKIKYFEISCKKSINDYEILLEMLFDIYLQKKNKEAVNSFTLDNYKRRKKECNC